MSRYSNFMESCLLVNEKLRLIKMFCNNSNFFMYLSVKVIGLCVNV